MIETIYIATPVGVLKIKGIFDNKSATLYQCCFTNSDLNSDQSVTTLDSFDHYIYRALNDYFNKNINNNALKLKPEGTTDFQNKVLDVIKSIPFGSYISYKKIAEKIHSPLSSRAVAQACKKNPIQLFIPCHRVLRHDDSLGGYQAGIDIKRKLLHHELGFDFS